MRKTQRILGELIKQGQEKGEIADRGENRYTQREELKKQTVTELGLSHKQSSAFQQIADIPEDDFENFNSAKREELKPEETPRRAEFSGKKLTVNGVSYVRNTQGEEDSA